LTYSLLTTWLLWPYPQRADRVVIDLGDTLHQLWTLRWTQHALFSDPTRLFAANVNYPYDTALALNQPTYTNAIITAPVYALTHNPVLTYNVAVLLSFTLAGAFTMLLVGELSGSRWAGLAAGILYAFAPVRQAHLYHLNLLSGYWMPLALWGLHRLYSIPREPARAPRPDPSGPSAGYLSAAKEQYPSPGVQGCLVALIGLALGAQVLAEFYHAFYLVLAVGLFLVWQFITHGWRRAKRYAMLSAAAVLLGVLIALPVLLPTIHAWRALHLQRSIGEHDAYSARLVNYLMTNRPRQLAASVPYLNNLVRTSGSAEHSLYPGLLTLPLGFIGLLRARRAGAAAFLYLLIALGALYFSLGPSIRYSEGLGGLPSPLYRWLYEHVPGFQGVRAASRWAFLLQLALAVLAGHGVAAVVELRPVRWWPPVAGVLLCTLLALDVWEIPRQGTEKFVGAPLPAVYQALAAQPPGAVLEFPLTNANSMLVYHYEYYSIFHWRPLVNSGSSIVPQPYIELSAILSTFPDARAVALLQALNVRYVVAHRYEMSGWAVWWRRVLAARSVRVLARLPDSDDALLAIDSDSSADKGPEVGGMRESPAPARLPSPIAERWVDAAGATGVFFETDVPLVLNRAFLYERQRRMPVGLEHANGWVERADVVLPTYLLHVAQVSWPGLAEDVVALRLTSPTGDLRVPLRLPPQPERVVAGPQVVGRPLPASIPAGTVLPCLLYGKGPLPIPGLVLSLNLVDASGRVRTKTDRFFQDGLASPTDWPAHGSMPVACDLAIPADVQPGRYTFEVGLYDPQTGQFVAIADPAGNIGSYWSRPIMVTASHDES